MVGRNAPTSAVRESGCEMMRRIARETRDEIDRLNRRAGELGDTIDQLKAEPNPDEGKIKMLEQTLASVEKQIEDNRFSLENIEIDISQNC